MENLNEKILTALKEMGKRANFDEILEITKGAPVSILSAETENPPVEQMRKAIFELWESGDITVWETNSHLFHKDFFKELLNNDA